MPETICRTVCQYSREPVPPDVMGKLLEIAKDYRAVKSYVFQRYGGISGLSKLYPGYEVQKEMTASGLRGELGIPAVYFYLAVFDALGDIRGSWTKAKSKIRGLTGQNRNFTEEDKHYLRFILKTDKAFAGILMQKPPESWGLPEELLRRACGLAGRADTERLHRYLRRQVRRHYARPRAQAADGFSISKGTCRYGDHGIYISTKESRKRVFLPLTDGNTYQCQMYVKLYPEEERVELRIPVRAAARSHSDYRNRTGAAFGGTVMLVTHEGHIYGKDFGARQKEIVDFVRRQAEKTAEGGGNVQKGKKYSAKLNRMQARLQSYVNMELNRFLREETPEVVYLPKLPPPKENVNGADFPIEARIGGYARERLLEKCQGHCVKTVKVPAENINLECSRCGALGHTGKTGFFCPACGYEAWEMKNAALNAKKRGTRFGNQS